MKKHWSHSRSLLIQTMVLLSLMILFATPAKKTAGLIEKETIEFKRKRGMDS